MKKNVIFNISLFIFSLSCGVGQTENNEQIDAGWQAELREKIPL